jgi:transposase-like protein
MKVRKCSPNIKELANERNKKRTDEIETTTYTLKVKVKKYYFRPVQALSVPGG